MSDAGGIPPPPWRQQTDRPTIPPPPWKRAPGEYIEPPGKDGAAPPSASTQGSGFQRVATPQQSAPGIGAQLWEGLKNFRAGEISGVSGEGVPKGKASEFEGGRAGFAGRMVGAAGRSVAEGLWEALKTPGQIAMGDKPFNPTDRQGTVEQALPTAMLMAGQGGRRPLVVPETAAPSAKPMLALPSPTVEVAGQPATATGVGPKQFGDVATQIMARGGGDRMLQSAQERLPQPGLIPAGPRATMTSPEATQLTGQPARPGAPSAAAKPAAPIISDAAPRSNLAEAIAGNDGGAVDRQLVKTYRGAIQPGKSTTKPSLSSIAGQDGRIVTAVDQIIASKPDLTLTHPNGQEIKGQLPQTRKQFLEAIDQTKKRVFETYDQMAQKAGTQGVQVDLAPVISRLREIADSPEVADIHPSVANDARTFAANMERRRTYSPTEAQDVIQNLNKTLSGFSRAPTHETVSRTTLLAPVAHLLRQQLDSAIDSAGMPGYQAARNQYKALRSVEDEVAAAVQKEINKRPGGGITGVAVDIVGAEEVMRGILTLGMTGGTAGWSTVARGAGLVAARRALAYANEPNRAIARMFANRADRSPTAPFTPISMLTQPYDRKTGLAMGFEGGQMQQENRGPMGGQIVGQRSIQRPASGYPSP